LVSANLPFAAGLAGLCFIIDEEVEAAGPHFPLATSYVEVAEALEALPG